MESAVRENTNLDPRQHFAESSLQIPRRPCMIWSLHAVEDWYWQTLQKVSGVNISDLTALYGQIVKKIVQKETIPSGEEGYYFALAHEIVWSEALQHLAIALKARGLVTDSKIQIWTSDEAAAESLAVPAPFVQILFNAG